MHQNDTRLYSLRKSKSLLRQVYHLFVRKKKKLPLETQKEIQSALEELQQEILEKNREKAAQKAKMTEALASRFLKKTSLEHVRDLFFALIFALIVALFVRQMWFEFYEIPSGSMRPTLKEQDRLVVSKTDFGINYPLRPGHFYFDPKLVQRNSIFIFTGENMDIRDVDTLYFYLFPGKKQYVKRLIGKPGDTLYFYGGQIFGVDEEGHDLSKELQLPSLSSIDHIPFIRFEGNVSAPSSSQGIYSPVVIYQMNEPVAKLFITTMNEVRGEMFKLTDLRNPSLPPITNYSELWGFKNFAMARLLTRDQVKELTDAEPAQMEEGMLYLELKHHPSLSSGKLIRDEFGRLRPSLGISTTLIPLQESHLRTLFAHLYTARFIVRNGFAMRYGMDPSAAGKNAFLPHLPGVPNGCYEFYEGKAYQVQWQGLTKELPPTHPLYRFDPTRLQLLFNIGMEFDMRFAPQTRNQRFFPARYAYFRNHDLYLLGAPILAKEDPTLTQFLSREQQRANLSSAQTPYHPFADSGPPLLQDGTVDAAFIKQYGLKIPSKMYLALGDNHAMSADSREFGFVPQDNLRGGPEWIFWPLGERFGSPNQVPYPWITFPRLFIWGLAVLICLIFWGLHHRKNSLPLKFKL